MNRHDFILVLIAAAAGCGLAAEARAATAQREQFQSASGFCQAALPAYEGRIRKRPTAIANEGTGSAFVSCSMPSDPGSVNGAEAFVLVLYNRAAASRDVTCSLVNEFLLGGSVFPKTLSIQPGTRQFFTWTRTDAGGIPLRYANFSCNLKPGTDIAYGYYTYSYEIGA